ncbi:GNAT family N-acetyltransferase [Alicyclobacillus curvatus]|nr:GNAT family N-acetyltransferase [Alicyclobacillus curvatus]
MSVSEKLDVPALDFILKAFQGNQSSEGHDRTLCTLRLKGAISLPVRNMPEETVVNLVSQFEAIGVRVWMDGGWAVDALLGQQTRPHGDLDIVVQSQEVRQTRYVLESLGYQDKVDCDTRPWNFVMADEAGHEIDFHVIEFDEDGNGVYGPSELGLFYPTDSLTGQGVIGRHPVSCVSPEWLVRFHTGYEFDEQDVHDVMALHRRFGVPLPDEYISLIRKTSDDRDAHADEQLVTYSPLTLPTEAKEILRGALYHLTSDKMEAVLSSVYVAPNTCLFGLLPGERIVAVMGIRCYRQSVAEILHIAVDEESRGKGYGRRIIQLVVQKEALTDLSAETDGDAAGFYERCGFSVKSLGEKYPGVERFLCRWGTDDDC